DRTMTEEITQSPPKRQRWSWFVLGFLLVFIGLALFLPKMWVHPDGASIVQGRLWQYYLTELPAAFRPRPLGLGSGQESALSVLAFHLFLSALGGLVAVWAVRQRQ